VATDLHIFSVSGIPEVTTGADLAALIAAMLLAAGAVTNAVGIVDDVAEKAAAQRG